MRTVVWILAAVCACTDTADHYPIQPGAGVPAGGATGTSGGAIAARVCIADDLRSMLACSNTDAGGLAVTLGSASAVTKPDGTFTINAPADTSNLAYTVSGPGVIPSSTPFSAATSIPVASADLFGRMLAANGIVLTQGSGSIIGTLTRGDAPVTGMTVTSTPSPAFGPFYDGATPTAWTLNATGTRGVFWAPGVSVGPTLLTFSDLASGNETTVDGVQVVNGGVTFVDTILP